MFKSLGMCTLLSQQSRRSEDVQPAKAGEDKDFFIISTLLFSFGEDKEYFGL